MNFSCLIETDVSVLSLCPCVLGGYTIEMNVFQYGLLTGLFLT